MSITDKKILVVVAGVGTSSHVLEAAIERAEQESTSLVVLHVMPYRAYDKRHQSLASNRDLTYDGHTFTRTQAITSAQGVAERAAKAVIGDRAVPFTAVGRVGELVPTVLAVAADQECDAIMLPEIESWWRRTIGRADRRIAKRFEGTVIRVPQPPPENLKTVRPIPEA